MKEMREMQVIQNSPKNDSEWVFISSQANRSKLRGWVSRCKYSFSSMEYIIICQKLH